MMNYYGNYGGWGYGMGYGDFGLWTLFWHAIVVIFVVWLVLRIIFGRGSWRHRHHVHGMWKDQSAVGILDERFAKGEIDKAEYEERKKALLG